MLGLRCNTKILRFLSRMSTPLTPDHANLATVVGYPVRIVGKALACGSQARGWARGRSYPIATTSHTVALASGKRAGEGSGRQIVLELYGTLTPEMAMAQSHSRSEPPNWLPGRVAIATLQAKGAR